MFAMTGGPVLHRAASLAHQTTPRLRTLVRPHQTDAQGDSQHAVFVVHEPDRRQLHHRSATVTTLQRVCTELPWPGRSAHHLQQHSLAALSFGSVSTC